MDGWDWLTLNSLPIRSLQSGAKIFAAFPKAIDLFSNIQIIIKREMHKIYKIGKLVSELALKQFFRGFLAHAYSPNP